MMPRYLWRIVISAFNILWINAVKKIAMITLVLFTFNFSPSVFTSFNSSRSVCPKPLDLSGKAAMIIVRTLLCPPTAKNKTVIHYDIQKTAISALFGLFELTRMIFEVCNGA